MTHQKVATDHQNSDQVMIEATRRLLMTEKAWLGESFVSILQPIGEFFDIDRISLCLFEPVEHSFLQVNQWCHLGVKPRKIQVFPVKEDASQDILKRLQSGPILFNQLQHEHLDKSWLSSLANDSIQSMMIVPILKQGEVMGYLTLENLRRPHDFIEVSCASFDVFIHVLQLKLTTHLLEEERLLQKEHFSSKQNHQYAFVANVSHEIRTPLNGIHNALYLMQTTDLTKDQKEYVEIGQRSADHLSMMVDRILDLEALESGNMDIQKRSFNLEDELVRLIQMHQRSANQKSLMMNLEFDYGIQHDIIADDKKIRQILSHLLSNAIKFTEKGSITLGCSINDETHHMVFTVRDTGIGIPKESLSHIFDAFYLPDVSDRREYQGLGIGLTIVKQLTHLLGGTLFVESELQQGSLFSVSLPYDVGPRQSFEQLQSYDVLIIHEQKPSLLMPIFSSMGSKVCDEISISNQRVDIIIFEVNVKSQDALNTIKETYGKHDVIMFALAQLDQKRFKKMDGILELPISRMMLLQRIMRTFHELHKTVASQYTKKISGHALIVDDNRLNRIALESILHNIGMTSLLAENGTRAIEMVKEHMFDVILMDIQMPHMDGLEATRRIRSLGTNSSKVPIIAVTANAYFNDYDMLKATQINDVIYKPIKMESLSQILRKHLVSVDTLHIPDELLVFDRHDFLKRFEGSYDIAKEVIMTFQQEYPKDLEKIRSAVQLRHAEQIISAAHYFKGSCAYVSGKRLVWLLNVMMERAKKNDLDDMNDVFHLLMKESDELMTHLESMKAITS